MNVKEINSAFSPEFVVELLGILNKHGIISDIEIRNAIIRKEYYEAKARGDNIGEFIEKKANEICRSTKAVDYILFGQQKKMKNNAAD